MDKETLSSYGWIVIVIIIIALVILLASPFGKAVKGNLTKAFDKITDNANTSTSMSLSNIPSEEASSN